MSILADMIKEEHVTLLRYIERIRLSDIRSGFDRELFFAMKVLLLEHLKKEDKYLYPALEALKGGGLIAKSYAEEMKQLSQRAMALIGKIEKSNFDPSLAGEFGQFVGALKARVVKEDESLLPLLDANSVP